MCVSVSVYVHYLQNAIWCIVLYKGLLEGLVFLSISLEG